MRKLASVLLASALFAGAASASVLSKTAIESDIKKLAENSSDVLAAKKLYARVIHKQNSPKAVMAVWSDYDKQGDYGIRWGEVGLNILRWSNLADEPNWSAGVSLPGESRLVYQQNSLIDLDRVAYNEVKYPIKNHNGFQVLDIMKPIRNASKTSQRLMLEGRAPIAADNYPIMVCRIGLSSQAPYVELSKTQMKKFTEITGLDYSNCLFGDSERQYWITRLKDFLDVNHVRDGAVVGLIKAL